ncbi:hypothetical protein [Glycomyces sp. NPDC048151]|uniref:hypothetical protein n=1 Tax=Glycomyces sp. NPDC048151 TaxID=3364002 RepID=UPI00371E9A6A
MTAEEAAEVLRMVARADRRTVAADDIRLWAMVLTLAGVERDEALRAVVEHIAEAPDTWLQVGHVVQRVKRERRRSLARSGMSEQELLRGLDPDAADYDAQVLAVLRAGRADAARGRALTGTRPELGTGQARADRARRGAARVREALAGRGIGRSEVSGSATGRTALEPYGLADFHPQERTKPGVDQRIHRLVERRSAAGLAARRRRRD